MIRHKDSFTRPSLSFRQTATVSPPAQHHQTVLGRFACAARRSVAAPPGYVRRIALILVRRLQRHDAQLTMGTGSDKGTNQAIPITRRHQ